MRFAGRANVCNGNADIVVLAEYRHCERACFRRPERNDSQFAMRWLTCAIPPLVFILHQLTPGVTFMNPINAAALLVTSPLFAVLGFALTAGIFIGVRLLVRRFRWRDPSFTVLALSLIGLINVGWHDPLIWLLLEVTSLPAAILLAPKVLPNVPAEPEAPLRVESRLGSIARSTNSPKRHSP